MPMSTVYRDMHHTDHEHAARVNGFGAGYDHANYVDNVTSMPDATVPSEYADVAAVWDEAYQDGKDDYAATEEDEATYGHDWRG